MNDATNRKVSDALRSLEDAFQEHANEQAKELWAGSDEYHKALDAATKSAMQELSVFLTASEYDEEGYGSGPVICIMPKSDESQSSITLTLEGLLSKESEDTDLAMWLDEMERLLKLHGRMGGEEGK